MVRAKSSQRITLQTFADGQSDGVWRHDDSATSALNASLVHVGLLFDDSSWCSRIGTSIEVGALDIALA